MKEITVDWTYTSSHIPKYVLKFFGELSRLRDMFN